MDDKALRQKILSQKDTRLFNIGKSFIAFKPIREKTEEYASILRIAKGNVYRIVQHYNNKGKDFNRELHWDEEEKSEACFL